MRHLLPIALLAALLVLAGCMPNLANVAADLGSLIVPGTGSSTTTGGTTTGGTTTGGTTTGGTTTGGTSSGSGSIQIDKTPPLAAGTLCTFSITVTSGGTTNSGQATSYAWQISGPAYSSPLSLGSFRSASWVAPRTSGSYVVSCAVNGSSGQFTVQRTVAVTAS